MIMKVNMMKAVIIAGGKGTRLSQYTSEIPKPMLLIDGKPVLEHQIEVLKNNGITEIFLTVGHLKEVIMDYFKDGSRFGVKISYITEDTPLGTAGAFYYLKGLIEETFFVIFGDILFDMDINKLKNYHDSRKASITLVVHPNSHPFDSDLVICTAENRVTAINKKNSVRDFYYSNVVNSGAYMMDSSVLNYFVDLKKIDLEKDLVFSYIEQGRDVFAYKTTEYLKDMGTYKRFEEVGKQYREGLIRNRRLSQRQKCIFLDRDGTINKKQKGEFISSTESFVLEDGVAEAIKKINESGFLCIVVSNQPVIARNLCTFDELENIHRKMETLLGEQGAYVDDIFYCPHHPDSGYPEERKEYKIQCSCRKPKIGMIEDAVKKYSIDLKQSYMIGDTTVDIMTGKNAGMKTILVLTGDKGTDNKYDVKADRNCKSLNEAVDAILGHDI